MGGEIQWSALDAVTEMLGVTAIEPFIAALVAMRDWQQRKHEEAMRG